MRRSARSPSPASPRRRAATRTWNTTCPADGAELVDLGRRFDLPVVEDLGSGHLHELAGIEEPTVRESIAAGVAVCTFSGDKLLGGP